MIIFQIPSCKAHYEIVCQIELKLEYYSFTPMWKQSND